MLRIKTLSVKELDGLKINTPEELEIGPRVNIYIGRNGSGKTKLLSSIASARYLGSENGTTAGSSSDDKITLKLSTGATVRRTTDNRWLGNEALKDQIHYIGINRVITSQVPNHSLLSELSRPQSVGMPLDVSGQLNIGEEIHNSILSGLFHKLNKVLKDQMPILEVEVIKEYKDGLIDFDKELRVDFTSGTPICFIDHNDDPIMPENLSDGEKQFLYFYSVIRKVSTYKDKIILIDEPEMHLHSTQIKKLCELIENLSEHNQVFVATHSSEVLQHFANKANLYLLSKGQLTSVKFSTEHKDVVNELGFPIDPSFFTSKWICMENEEGTKLPGDNAPNTIEVMEWLFGTRTNHVHKTFGSNKDNITAIEKAIRSMSNDESNKFLIILDGDKLIDTSLKFPEFKLDGELLYLPCWEIENIFLNPELLAKILEEEGKDRELIWSKVEEQKSNLAKSIAKTVIKNTLQKNHGINKSIKGNNPIEDLEKWKESVAKFELNEVLFNSYIDKLVKEKNWHWLPGKEVMSSIVVKEIPKYWSCVRELSEEEKLIGTLKEDSVTKGFIEYVDNYGK